ncbi:MAG: gamma-glutamyl-gamma-aminobutyrate hydrolase family protein [Planctomycetota bacterium]
MASVETTIGISCDVTAVDVPRLNVQLTYIDFVAAGGAVPIVLPPHASALEALHLCDGVLFVGADDYRCGNRNGEPAGFTAVHPRRESTDIELARAVLDRDIPCLSVCGGFQLMALVAGGSIFGDLDTEAPPSAVRHKRERPEQPLVRHSVTWSYDDKLPGVAAGDHEINSHHHQAVSVLPPDWRSVGVAPDGIVEAALGPGRFQLGAQWHPEREPESAINDGLLRAFLGAAGTYRQSRIVDPTRRKIRQ